MKQNKSKHKLNPIIINRLKNSYKKSMRMNGTTEVLSVYCNSFAESYYDIRNLFSIVNALKKVSNELCEDIRLILEENGIEAEYNEEDWT